MQAAMKEAAEMMATAKVVVAEEGETASGVRKGEESVKV
jgi:hypothetical protein